MVSKVNRWTVGCIYFSAIAACASTDAAVIRAEDSTAIHNIACLEPRKSDSKWNIQELYNCEIMQLFFL